MTLSSALSVALSGLQVSTAQLQVASNNIANAQTAGYTDKSMTTSAVILGQQSGGVQISSYNRATNSALTTSLNNATSSASYYNTQNTYMGQVQTILDSTDSNPALSSAVSQFQSAWTTFQSAPESQADQQAVVEAGNNLAQQVQSVSSGITSLNLQVTSDINTNLTNLNADLSQVASLNTQIASAGSQSSGLGSLEDERDQVINQIAAITNVTVMQRPSGQVALYTQDGVLLVDGSAQSFSYNGQDVVSSSGQVVTNDLTGGSLQAQLQFLAPATTGNVSTNPANQVLSKLTSQLTMLVNAFTTTSSGSFSSAYDSATTGSGELPSGFFTASTSQITGLVDPATFAVNSKLLSGASTVKQAAASSVLTALSTPQIYPPTSPTGLGLGLSANQNGDYSDMASAVLAYFQQGANTVQAQNTTATQQQTYYQQAVSNATGVNVDSELVNLTTLQNSYAASAHVISTIQQMYTDLEGIISG